MEYLLKCARDFNDHAITSEFGKHQAQLSEIITNERYDRILIDLSETQWASPIAMLAMGCLIAELYQKRKIAGLPIIITVNLGNSPKYPRVEKEIQHNLFVRFAASQGLLDVFADNVAASFDWNNTEYSRTSLEELKNRIAFTTDQNLEVFPSADFIKAKVLLVNNYYIDEKMSEKLLQEYIELLLHEAGTRVIDTFYTNEPQLRDHYFQKLRIVLRELIGNAIEHAYTIDRHGHVGIYARLRTASNGKSGLLKRDERYQKAIKDELDNEKYPTLRNFSNTGLQEWLELFVVDTGTGLSSADNISSWIESALSKGGDNKTAELTSIINVLQKASQSKNPLRMLKQKLFITDISRFNQEQRMAEYRPEMTGLRHVGLTLTKENDYLRIYANGEWVGADHPWRIDDTANHLRVPLQKEKPILKGTFIQVCIPNKYHIKYPAGWITNEKSKLLSDELLLELGKKETTIIRAEKHHDRVVAIKKRIKRDFAEIYYLNKRGNGGHIAMALEKLSAKAEEFAKCGYTTVMLRASRSMSKNELYRFLEFFVGTRYSSTGTGSDQPRVQVKSVVLVDLSPFQGLVFQTLVQDILHNRNTETLPTVVLQTENWGFFVYNPKKAPHGESSDEYSKLANLPIKPGVFLDILRADDSLTFWSGLSLEAYLNADTTEIPEDDDCYLDQEIVWSRIDGKPLRITGYLDLPQALADPKRFDPVRRALQRALSLYAKHRPQHADSLVKAVITEVDKRIQLRNQGDFSKLPPVVVGSILVTGNTVISLERQNVPYIHLFIHPDNVHQEPETLPRALDWLPSGRSSVTLQYPERIRETPFIGSGGDFGIGLGRGANNSYQMPDIAYQTWGQQNVMKIGHWVYEGHHDLLTINPFRSFDLSFFDGASDPYRWLQKQLIDGMADNPTTRTLLIYPSHPAVDLMISKVKGLAEKRIFPIKFIGHSTVSPFRASPLGLERLTREINRAKGAGLSVRVIVFDDATRTGKMMNELTQLAKHAGADVVSTLAILDRSGLPAYGSLLTDHLKDHPRLWRWDIPKLGHDRDCPLCAALSQIQHVMADYSVSSLKQRITEIKDTWRTRSLLEEWSTAEQLNHSFQKPVTISFRSTTPSRTVSIINEQLSLFSADSYGGNTRVERLPIDHISAVSYCAMCLEIARISTRADLPLTKQDEKFRDDVDTSLILVCSQLFLFYDELTWRQRFERASKLLEILLTKEYHPSPWSGLAVLSFALIDSKTAKKLMRTFCETLWPEFEKKAASNPSLGVGRLNWAESPDLFIAMHLVEKASKVEGDGIDPDAIEVVNVFLKRMNSVDKHKDTAFNNIIKLFHYLGVTSRSSHMTDYHRAFNDVESSDHTIAEKAKERVQRQTKDIIGILDQMINNYLFYDNTGEIILALKKYNKSISEYEGSDIPYLKYVLFGDTEDAFSRFLRQTFLATSSIYRPSGNVDQYIPSLGNRINEIVGEIQTNWSDYFEIALRDATSVSEVSDLKRRWNGVISPRIRCIKPSEGVPITAPFILWTPAIKECISELIRNCVHRDEPLSAKDGSLDDLVYECKEANDGKHRGIILQFANTLSSANSKLKLKHSLYMGDAERMGVEINTRIENIEDKPIGYTEVYFPYFNTEK